MVGETLNTNSQTRKPTTSHCRTCGAWLGSLGMEPNPTMYVEHMVSVFREVRRVLRNDGTVYLNLGDCYVSNPHGMGRTADPKYPNARNAAEDYGGANRAGTSGLKSKDLVMIPARVAIALQDDGWYLRSQIPWVKRNGMVESTADRPTAMVEYIFLLAKEESYFYDLEAVLKPQAEHERTRRLKEQERGLDTVFHVRRDDESHGQNKPGCTGVAKSVKARHDLALKGTRARRNTDWLFESFNGLLTDPDGDPLVMLVNPQPFEIEMCSTCEKCYKRGDFNRLEWNPVSEKRICECGAETWLSHFATFNKRLVQPCIEAGTSEHGCCNQCGAPYERVVEKANVGNWNPNPDQQSDRGAVHKISTKNRRLYDEMQGRGSGNKQREIPDGSGGRLNNHRGYGVPWTPEVKETVDWLPTCSHPLFPSEVVPCTVLDPFSGAGTTGLTAIALGRNYIGIEMNPAYIKISMFRRDLQVNKSE